MRMALNSDKISVILTSEEEKILKLLRQAKVLAYSELRIVIQDKNIVSAEITQKMKF